MLIHAPDSAKSKGHIDKRSRKFSRWGFKKKKLRLQYYIARSISPDHAMSSYAFKNSRPLRVSGFARTWMPGLRTSRLEMRIQRDLARLIPTLRRRLVKRKLIWLDND